MRRWLARGVLLLLGGMAAPAWADGDPALAAALAGPQRSPASAARDVYRHPAAELAFFGLRPDMTMVEIWPGGGWWTENLAPYLHDHGTYYVALPDKDDLPPRAQAGLDRFAAKLAANPAVYGKVITTNLWGDKFAIAPAGSADLVMTSRNLHDWMPQGTAEGAMRAFFKALKPGGVLGIDDHRANTDKPQDPMAKDGYVREDYAIALAEKVGFVLAGRSGINDNPKDTKDYPAGVWTLPPTLRLGDQDRAKYLAIGESDVFTMKFVKPK